MRRLYRKRQQQLREALAQELTILMNCLAARGLHLTVAIDNVDDRRLCSRRGSFSWHPGIKPFLPR
jgi:GntR family transcriptional regulator/MocR family aminotransferase